jgi:two-component system cell cycle sensor histidine kinase/response regulator CckA
VTPLAQARADDRRRLLSAWEGSPFGVSLLDASGCTSNGNAAMESISGYTLDELTRIPVSSYTHPDDNAAGVALFRRLLAGEIDSYRLEMRLIQQQGGLVWVDCYVTSAHEAQDGPPTALAMVQDITSRKLAEVALREQNDRLSRLVETQAELAAAADLGLQGVAQIVAERAQELTGADGATASIRDGDELMAHVTTGLSVGTAQFSVPLLLGSRNVGSLGVVKAAGVTDAERRTIELLAVLLSSAVSQAAEREARRLQVEALARFEAIFESAPIGIGLVSLDGRLRNTNSVMREISGRTADELASGNVLEYTVPEDIEQVTSLFAAMLKGKFESYRHELRIYAKNGGVVWVDSATAILRDADGRPQGAVTMAQDITQRRAADEQLRQSQKIDAIGQLAAGIAHDFNNLLLGMLGYTELARVQIGVHGQAAEYLSRVEACAQRAATLTGQLLAFGRRQALDLRPLDLNALVTETVGMLRSVVGERIALVTALDSSLDRVRADGGQMHQVLLNLALNAKDAMPEGGTLTVSTSNVDIGKGGPFSGELEPGRYVVLSVKDDGSGMADGIRDRIFDPFFTTKSVGKGTGLGLSSAHGIVKQSGGHIEVASELGSGSEFQCYLPAVAVDLGEPELMSEPLRVLNQAPHGAGRRILVIEDEEIVRTLLAETLEQLGYVVETAEDPSFALPILRDRGREFALVISDLMMPHMTGAAFASDVAGWLPELPFVFVSGYSEEGGEQPAAVARGLFLQKPFTSDALAVTVRTALAGRGASDDVGGVGEVQI